MRVETGLRSGLSNVVDSAQRAEALGYDGITTPETAHDPFLPLVIAAEHTNLDLGTSVAIAFPRSPMVLAYLCWDLQAFSGGRLRLGLGTQVKGHNERRFSVPWSPPAPRMREYVGGLKAIWNSWATGERLNFQGEHYRFTLMNPLFAPEPIDNPNVPVYVSAVGPVMCQVAGEICDGLRMHSFNTPKYVQDVILPNLEKGAKKAGRSLQDLDLVCAGFTIVGESDDEIRAAKRGVASQIAFYGSTRTYQSVFDVHGWGDKTAQLHELSLQGGWDKMGDLITDEMLEDFAVVGNVEDAAREVVKRYGSFCSTVSFTPPASIPDDRKKAAIAILKAA